MNNNKLIADLYVRFSDGNKRIVVTEDSTTVFRYLIFRYCRSSIDGEVIMYRSKNLLS
jgi:hypothetical protein